MRHITLSISLVLCFSFASYACSCMGWVGHCYLMNDDGMNVALGDVIDTISAAKLDSNGVPTDTVWTGIVFKVKEDLRQTGLDDTITIWSLEENWNGYACFTSITYLAFKENILLTFIPDSFTIDSVESFKDYRIVQDVCVPGYLYVDGDTVRGNDGAVYSSWVQFDPQLHPSSSYKSSNALYSDFKNRIQNNLTCLDYSSIHELPSSTINIYPNPATDIITFELPANFKPNEVRLYNMKGQAVLTKPLNGNTIDVSELASGPYFVELRDDNHLVRKKVFIEH